MFALALLQLAVAQTQVFSNDEALVEWVNGIEELSRPVLPIIGPASMARWEGGLRGLVHIVHVDSDRDPDEAALEARLEVGSPCAVLISAVAKGGWIGSTSGSCGMLNIAGWRWDGRFVLDGTQNPVPITRFAAHLHDEKALRTYRRLDRLRSVSIVLGMVGTSLLVIGELGNGSDRLLPVSVTGGVVLLGGAGLFLGVHVDPRSNPRRIGAYYSDERIHDAVIEYNRRLQLRATPFGVVGRFR